MISNRSLFITGSNDFEENFGTLYLPDVTQFKYYSACKQMFLQIPLEESYLLVLRALKKRMHVEKEAFVKIPDELKFLAYFMELTHDDYHQKLDMFLERQYGGAEGVFGVSVGICIF
jgi:hypothetical protein